MTRAEEMLQAYKDRHANKYKDVFKGYFMAAREFTERTGQPAPTVLFALGQDVFTAASDGSNGFNLEPVNTRNKQHNQEPNR